MKKLLLVGSCSVHIFNFLELVEDYFDEIVLLTHKDCQKRPGSAKVTVEKMDFRFFNFFNIFRIYKLLRRFRPTHIHIHQANNYAFFTLLAAMGYRAKKILNVWGSDILVNPKKSLIHRLMAKFSLKRADYVIGDSNHLLKEAQRLAPSVRTCNINFGVEPPRIQTKKEKIIYSNRLHKKLYNIDKIIRSFSKFVQQEPCWKLILAGDGEETSNLKQLVKELGIEKNVEFVGFVDRKKNSELYAKAQIYVSVPQSDSVSLSLIEAILHRCIVFVSDLEANKEVVDERIGFIESDLENMDFSKYLSLLGKDHDEVIERLKKNYSKEYNKKRLIELYEK